MLQKLLPLALLVPLAGCGLTPFEMGDQAEAPKPFPTTLGVSIPPSQAMAAMPVGAGQVIAVVERRRGNAVQHDITLAGAPPNYGENQINVTAFRYVNENPSHPIEDKLEMRRPTDEDIYKEMQERIPGGALPTSNAVPRNAQGAFGYAFARRNGGVSCLYAWQWVDPPVTRQFHPINNKTTPAPVGVRVRLCKPGMTEEVMVDLVRQMYVAIRYDDATRGYPGGYHPGLMAGGGQRRMGGDALSASGGYGRSPMYGNYATGYGDQDDPRTGYASSYNYPKYQNVSPQTRAVAATPVRRRVVRRAVARRPAPQQDWTISSAPAAQRLPAAPAAAAAPGGYSAVPMPQ